jgi:hypothetical protein
VIKTEFLMWNAAQHNVTLLFSMNVQIHMIQNKSLLTSRTIILQAYIKRKSRNIKNNMAKESYPYKII